MVRRPKTLLAEQLLPRVTNAALGTREVARHRKRAVVGLAGGCHLDRRIGTLITEAGFGIQELHNDQTAGPALLRPWDYRYCGVAAKAPGAPS